MKRISDSEWDRMSRSDGSFETEQSSREQDKREFLNAVDEMTSAPAEKIHVSDLAVSPNVRHLPRKSMFSVDETLDLHMKRKADALQLVDRFLDNERKQGNRLLCIVTGKGKHTEKQGILRIAVWNWLLKQGRQRIQWIGRAPRAMGGDGAIIVQLTGGGEMQSEDLFPG